MTSGRNITTVTLNPAIDQTVAIPDFSVGSVNRVREFRSDAGGKGVNVAAFLADYGLPVAVTGFLGDRNSHPFERLFAEKNVTDRFVRITGSTRTGIKVIDDVRQETTDINFPGFAPTPGDVQKLLNIIDETSERGRWFVIAGSIPTGTPPDIYRDIVTVISQKGGQVALDASGEGFRQAVVAGPALAKPNIDELQEFCGRTLHTRAEVIDAARRMLDCGLHTVVVSMGEKGALFIEENEMIQTVPPKVRVKSTVGAGDAMLAGMVAGKIETRSLKDSALLATIFSVIAVTHIGAGLPSEVSLQSISNEIQVNQIRA